MTTNSSSDERRQRLTELRAKEAHSRGLRDGAVTARAGVEPGTVDPYRLARDRHAAQYGNGWEHGYVFARRDLADDQQARSTRTQGRPGR